MNNMESTGIHAPPAAGPSTDASNPATHDDDNISRHFATTASQVPVPTGGATSSTTTSPQPSPTEAGAKDAKNAAMRSCGDGQDAEVHSPRLRSSRFFKGKDVINIEKERKRPLNLLDLPLDILKEIVKEVTHTNDLTSLALCHSALHRLATPHIYSRFDIVWPDTNTHAEPRSGVDALTYGLATLVMAEEIFGEAPEQRQAHANRFNSSGQGVASEMTVRRRRGNHYAQFTRKFSLGNGPSDWVQEYLITKEGGKMLGTLVALAVARMRALETFVWDMPTGILRDVWLALSSLGDRHDGRPCRLEKVGVRWHDNSSADATAPIPPPPPPIHPTHLPPPPLLSPTNSVHSPFVAPQVHPAALDRVEHPSFSVLPPLKSLSVLDIDELAYLDEMAVLIGKSLDKLRELRVGIARHAANREWVSIGEGERLLQIDAKNPTASSLTIGEKRLGGVLGTLTGFVCDMRKPAIPLPDRTRRNLGRNGTSPAKSPARSSVPNAEASNGRAEPLVEQSNALNNISSLREVLEAVPTAVSPADGPISPLSTRSLLSSDSAFENDPLIVQSSHHSSPLRTPNSEPEEPILPPVDIEPAALAAPDEPDEEVYLDRTLQLDSLELERIPLSVPVLHKAIDWTRLTSLTLLHCHHHEQLWKSLRRAFAPVPKSPAYPQPRRTLNLTPRKSGKPSYAGSDIELEYGLKLRKIHTNAVSPALISFLRDTIAPNTLEVLFLQDARSYTSPVTIDQIFKGPLRRHRNSLKKVLIDSSDKGASGIPTNSSRWRRWLFSREILSFICSGKMPALKELGMAIHYEDWHFFLQHLPSIPHLRSLSVPFLADHAHGSNIDPRELALQIVDIVALRPEVELCYMGISNKCFEILESRRSGDGFDARSESRLGMDGGSMEDDGDDDGAGGAGVGSDAEDDDDEDDDDEADGDAEADGENVPPQMASPDDLDEHQHHHHHHHQHAAGDADTESDEGEHDDDDDTDSEAGSSVSGRGRMRLRLREILFYDDKVAIFKARHGRL